MRISSLPKKPVQRNLKKDKGLGGDQDWETKVQTHTTPTEEKVNRENVGKSAASSHFLEVQERIGGDLAARKNLKKL